MRINVAQGGNLFDAQREFWIGLGNLLFKTSQKWRESGASGEDSMAGRGAQQLQDPSRGVSGRNRKRLFRSRSE
jgi:hypothetical protein